MIFVLRCFVHWYLVLNFIIVYIDNNTENKFKNSDVTCNVPESWHKPKNSINNEKPPELSYLNNGINLWLLK
jgi:hypothetical protein